MKSSAHKKCFPHFFQTISQLVIRLSSIFYKIPSDLDHLQSSRRGNISQLCLVWNYHKYSIIYFTACLQLVKLSTLFVFLRRGLLEQDLEFQEDQYLFEICLIEHSVLICHHIPISCISSYPSQSTACLSYNLFLCCICLDVIC